jgi:hypothetical protein
MAEDPTILVVDEDDDVRDVAVAMFEDEGYRVPAASSGHAALQVLRANPGIRLLFTDIWMPAAMDMLMLAHEVSGPGPTSNHLHKRVRQRLPVTPERPGYGRVLPNQQPGGARQPRRRRARWRQAGIRPATRCVCPAYQPAAPTALLAPSKTSGSSCARTISVR